MTRNKFNEELKQLLNSVRVMGVNLEDTLDKVIANLEQKDAALAQQIISDDDNFDNSEVNIEKQCLELVLTQTPVATDWREIASCLKLVGDMERIADHCSDISQYTLKLIEKEPSDALLAKRGAGTTSTRASGNWVPSRRSCAAVTSIRRSDKPSPPRSPAITPIQSSASTRVARPPTTRPSAGGASARGPPICTATPVEVPRVRLRSDSRLPRVTSTSPSSSGRRRSTLLRNAWQGWNARPPCPRPRAGN